MGPLMKILSHIDAKTSTNLLRKDDTKSIAMGCVYDVFREMVSKELQRVGSRQIFGLANPCGDRVGPRDSV